MPPPRLIPGRTALLVVDLQEKLVPHIHDGQTVVRQTARLIDGANALELAVLVTEQYPQGLGPTVPQVRQKLNGEACRYEKKRFSACVEPVRQQLADRGVRSVLVCGIEAHVCVLQTCLDLVAMGLPTAVVADAVGSRRTTDRDTALMRLTQVGVVPTTVEAALLELVGTAQGQDFQRVRPLIQPL